MEAPNKGSAVTGNNTNKKKKKKKNPQRQVTEKNTYTDLVPRSSVNKKKGATPGWCDICLQKDGFRDLTLLKCGTCGLTVHSNCYAMPRDHSSGNFECWACASVGQQVKVREKDPFTSQRISVLQKERPRECCLCSVQDGIHAMHPIYDAHGQRGRQIWLPPQSKGAERTLAWAHTMCALAVNANPFTSGTCYGCTRTGFYGDPDDLECVSDSESVNSELEVGDDVTGVADIHHFVYWGYYDRFMGCEADQWGKAIENHKRDLHCGFCGKDDSKVTTLPNGSEVFQSLRVPLQCTANNKEEFEEFRPHHKTNEACYQALHVGCALWGRNEAGEQSLARRVWYFPGKPTDDNPDLRNPVVEVYCDHHAQDLFENVAGSNMQIRGLPGPFYTTTKKKKKQKQNNQANAPKNNPPGVSAIVGVGAKAPLHMKAAKQKAKASQTKSAKASNPKKTSLVTDSKKRAADQQGGPKAKLQKTSQRSGSAPVVGNPIIPGLSRKSSAPEAAVTGTTSNRKRAHETTSAGAVALNQVKRTSKLVRDKKKRSGTDVDDENHLKLTQEILDDLLLHKKQCKARKEKFKATRIQRWMHWRSEADLPKEEFGIVFQNAVDAMKVGNLDDLKAKIAASKKRASEVQEPTAAAETANHSSAEVPLPSVPRRNSVNSAKSNQSKENNRDIGEDDDNGGDAFAENEGRANDVDNGEMTNNQSSQLPQPGSSAQPPNQAVSHTAEPSQSGPEKRAGLDNNTANGTDAEAEACSAVEDNPAGEGTGTSDKPMTAEERIRKERIQKIVDDLVSKIKPLKPPEDAGQEAEAESTKAVRRILKDCRTQWKEELRMPKLEYKGLFVEALDNVSAECKWFVITGRTPAPVAAPEPSSAPDPAQVPVSAADPATDDGPAPPPADKSLEENSSPPPVNHDDTTARRVGSPPVQSGQWSYLSLGKKFNKRGFDFDTWDSYEELPPKKMSCA